MKETNRALWIALLLASAAYVMLLGAFHWGIPLILASGSLLAVALVILVVVMMQGGSSSVEIPKTVTRKVVGSV